MENHRPIFYDERRRRWRRLRWILELTAVVLAIILIVFTASVLHRMNLPVGAQLTAGRPGLRPFLNAALKPKPPI